MPKLRIFMITPDFPPAYGGIQLLAERLARHLPRAQTTVLTSTPDPLNDVEGDEAFTTVRVPRCGNRQVDIGLLNAAAVRAAVRAPPDITIAMHVVVAPGAFAIRRATGAPVLQYLHAAELPIRPRLTRLAVASADAIIAVSRYTRSLALQAGAREERIHVIPPGTDPGLPPAVGRHASLPLVVTVSRLDYRYKGHDVLIRSFTLVRARVPNARLVVIGDGYLRTSLEALAEANGVSSAIHFAGAVSDHERDLLLAAAHVFTLPSRLPGGRFAGEGFGIVFIEAAARGLPVIGGNVGGAVDAVQSGSTGLLVDPTDHVAVADAISELLLDESRAASLGAAGLKWASQFVWPAIASRVRDVLADLVGESV